MYSHVPELLKLLNQPTIKNEHETLLDNLRAKYGDVCEEVKDAPTPRDMLQALYRLCTKLLNGSVRPGTEESQIENYDQCVVDYWELHDTVHAAVAV